MFALVPAGAPSTFLLNLIAQTGQTFTGTKHRGQRSDAAARRELTLRRRTDDGVYSGAPMFTFLTAPVTGSMIHSVGFDNEIKNNDTSFSYRSSLGRKTINFTNCKTQHVYFVCELQKEKIRFYTERERERET